MYLELHLYQHRYHQIYKVLENIIGIANDPCWINSIHTPSLLVEGLSIIN